METIDIPAAIRAGLVYITSLVRPSLPPPPYDEQGRTILGQFPPSPTPNCP